MKYRVRPKQTVRMEGMEMERWRLQQGGREAEERRAAEVRRQIEEKSEVEGGDVIVDDGGGDEVEAEGWSGD